MPNGKTDSNNKGPFSTDMIGMNHHYPEAGYAERERIRAARRMKGAYIMTQANCESIQVLPAKHP